LNACFNVLLVGCGNIGGGFDLDRSDGAPLTHAGAFAADPRFRISACVDPDPLRRARFVDRWKIADSAASIAALDPESHDFDVVSICSPTALHAEHIDEAIALRPRLIFCEKPVTVTAMQTAALVERCATAGIKFAVNHTRRWDPALIEMAGQVRRGDWGIVRSCTGWYNKGILNNGSHMIDTLRMIVGEIEPLWAGRPIEDHWPDDPTFPAMLRSAEGAPISLTPGDARDYALFEIRLITERGTIAVEDGALNWRERHAEPSPMFAGYTVLGPAVERPGRYLEAMREAARNVGDAIESDTPLSCDGNDALAAQRLCEALKSMAYGAA
jgi:predicted dehydrogenase